MLEWFTGKKKRTELPEYTRLRAVPTRPLPSEVAREESGELFRSRRTIIQEDLRRSYDDPQETSPSFTSLAGSNRRSFVTIPTPDSGGQCLPVFSSALRAADYRQTLLTDGPPVQYLVSTAAQLTQMLRDIEPAGIQSITLDRCPRCSLWTVIDSRSMKTSDDILLLWGIHKSGELARLELYFGWALKAARAGEFEAARDLALETVGHVSFEDPRPHALLGELAVALRDRTMLKEAQAFLRFLKHESWERRLAMVAESNHASFDDYEKLYH